MTIGSVTSAVFPKRGGDGRGSQNLMSGQGLRTTVEHQMEVNPGLEQH
jgi:hypothetical protein